MSLMLSFNSYQGFIELMIIVFVSMVTGVPKLGQLCATWG